MGALGRLLRGALGVSPASAAAAVVTSTLVAMTIAAPLGVQAVRAGDAVGIDDGAPIRADDDRFPDPATLVATAAGDPGAGDDAASEGIGDDPGTDGTDDEAAAEDGDADDGRPADTPSDSGDGSGSGTPATGAEGAAPTPDPELIPGRPSPVPTAVPTATPGPVAPRPTPSDPGPTPDAPGPDPSTTPTPVPTMVPTPTPTPTTRPPATATPTPTTRPSPTSTPTTPPVPTPTATPTPTPTATSTPTPTATPTPVGLPADGYASILTFPTFEAGQPTIVQVKGSNGGPNPLPASTRVTISVTGGVITTVTEGNASWSCSRTADSAFVCSGPLPSRWVAQKDVAIVATGSDAITLTVTLIQTVPDPDPRNNTATRTFAVGD